MKRKRKAAECAAETGNKDGNIQERGPFIKDLPNDVLFIVLLKLPTRSILLCKCVCKTWLRLISSPKFAKMHFAEAKIHPLVRPLGPTRVSRTLYLVEPEDNDGFDRTRVNDCGDDEPCIRMNLAKYKIPLRNAELIIQNHANAGEMLDRKHGTKRKPCLKLRRYDHKYDLVNSCMGLLCLSEPMFNDPAVVSNPITGEFINLPEASKHENEKRFIDCGFGFGTRTKEFKVIRMFNQGTSDPKRVAEIHSLGTGAWKPVGSAPDVWRKLAFTTYLKGVLYWFCYTGYSCTIVSFDLNTEKFQSVLSLPFQMDEYRSVSLGALGGYLCLIDVHPGSHINIWELKDSGAQKLWRRKISIETDGDRWPSGIYRPIKYLNNDHLLMFNCRTNAFVYYRLKSYRYKFLKLRGFKSDFEAVSHVPSLISLKSILRGKDVEVLNINSRCAGLKLLGETKALYLKEESADLGSDFFTSSDSGEE